MGMKKNYLRDLLQRQSAAKDELTESLAVLDSQKEFANELTGAMADKMASMIGQRPWVSANELMLAAANLSACMLKLVQDGWGHDACKAYTEIVEKAWAAVRDVDIDSGLRGN